MTDTEPEKGIPGQDITVQSHRLARYLDRLPAGNYSVNLTKIGNELPWRVSVVSLDSGTVVRELWVIDRESRRA